MISRKYRWMLGILAAGVISAAWLFAKAFHFGWELRHEASLNGYEVKSFKTVTSMNPRAFFVNDASGGYYRIFDKRGRKVFELFSDSLNFDVVLTKGDGVEFQLDDETRIWTPPKK